MLYGIWLIDVRILRSMVCGIPLVLDLGTRISDPYVYVVFEPLLLQEADYVSLGDRGLGGRREERSISVTAVVVEPCYRRLVSKITTVTGIRCVRIVVSASFSCQHCQASHI